MRYRVGMYGGSLYVYLFGHLHDIIRAAAMCEELYVMISWCEGRESTSKELRYRWIHNNIRHLHNVKIIMIEDKAVSKEVYNTDYYWEKGAEDIKAAIGKPIDAVFCGTDYLGTGRFESLYCPESEVIYFDRSEVPVSSTSLRFDVYANWQYIPPICRPYYVKRVLIAGGESTGKSTLVKNLAIAYNTNFVREIGRDTCDIAGGEDFMNMDDLCENFLRQKTEEIEAAYSSNRILFIDTDAVTTKFYSHFLLKKRKKFKNVMPLRMLFPELTASIWFCFWNPRYRLCRMEPGMKKLRRIGKSTAGKLKCCLMKPEWNTAVWEETIWTDSIRQRS